jgi:PAS domain S-box-containing protein
MVLKPHFGLAGPPFFFVALMNKNNRFGPFLVIRGTPGYNGCDQGGYPEMIATGEQNGSKQPPDKPSRLLWGLVPITVLVVVLLVLVGGVYSLVVLGSLKTQAQRENLDANQALAEMGARFIADHQQALLARLSALASSPGFISDVANLRRDNLGRTLSRVWGTLSRVSGMLVATPRGRVIVLVRSSGLVNAAYRRLDLPFPGRRGAVSPVRRGLTADAPRVIYLAVGIRDQGRPVGILAVEKPPAFWASFFSLRLTARPGRTFYLFDQLGRTITTGGATCPDPGSCAVSWRKFLTQVRRHHPLARLMTDPDRRGRAFVAGATVPGHEWVLVVSHDYESAMAGARTAQSNILVFFILLFLCLSTLGVLLVGRYQFQKSLLRMADSQTRLLETQVQARTEALAQATNRYRDLLTDLPDIVYEIDREGRFTFVSEAAHDLLGWRQDEMVGRPRRQLLDPADRPRYDQALAQASPGEEVRVMALRHLHKKGGVRWLSSHSREIMDAHGRVVGRRGVARDVTQQVLAEQKVRELSGRLVEAQEEERARLALDLHDEMGQLLSALKIGLQTLARRPDQTDEGQADIKQLIDLSQKIMDRVRSLAYQLRPAILDNFGLAAAIEDLGESIQATHGIEISYQLEKLPEDRLSPGLTIGVFRFVQECLTNVARHSGSRTARIELAARDGWVEAVVSDRGCGFNVEEALDTGLEHRRLGLLGMQDRLGLIGGELMIESSPMGSRLTARVPIQEEGR